MSTVLDPANHDALQTALPHTMLLLFVFMKTVVIKGTRGNQENFGHIYIYIYSLVDFWKACVVLVSSCLEKENRTYQTGSWSI